MLEKQRVIEALTHKQESRNKELIESLVHRQNIVLLQRKLRDLHPADLAHVLEALPQADRLVVWAELDAHRAAQVLLEAPRAARRVTLAPWTTPHRRARSSRSGIAPSAAG